jgi:hypothetical protein
LRAAATAACSGPIPGKAAAPGRKNNFFRARLTRSKFKF